MSSNKYLIEDRSTLLQNKLQSLATALDSNSATREFQTEEEVIQEALKILGSFFESLNEPGFDPAQVRADDLPDHVIYNDIWNQLLDNLEVIFTELENLGNLTVANFNYMATESNRLTARLKNISSLLGDYILYTNNASRDAYFFKDSFNDLSKIDSQSSLLNEEQCEIDQDEGIITLPINGDQSSEVKVKSAPIINPNSNGQPGNNQELGAKFNGDPLTLLDNNPDTWFEYERVTTKPNDNKDPLILDMTMNLGDEQIINYIRINPNNFGTKTGIVIDTIETSLDGQVYTNIKDDIPIADFVTEDEDNVFTLAPATSKFAGQGIYSFLPRKVKYVHLVFTQSESYVIDTPTGEKLRYAIGIRDIDVRAYQYLSKGEIISKPFELTDDIRKVILDSNQNPSEESELATIQYYVSPDDGQTWNEIQPKSFSGFSGKEDPVPEIINFNGPEEDSIPTTVPVRSLRVKAILTRVDEAFADGSSTLKKEVLPRSELHEVPNASPFNFELEQPPVNGSVEVIDPFFGSRGLADTQYILGNSDRNLSEKQKFYLPLTNLNRPFKKVGSGSPATYSLRPVPMNEWIHVTVGGLEWQHATAALSTYSANYSTDPQYRLFTFDPSLGILTFGNGKDTMSPPTGYPIGLYFEPERLFPSETPDKHLAKLDFRTGNNKDVFAVKRYNEVAETTEILSRRAMVLHLQNANVTDYTGITSALVVLGFNGSPTTYVNGKDELGSTTAWSINTIEGIVYLGAPTPSNSDVTVSYKYQEVEILETDEWDWGNTTSIRDSISIKESAWKTIEKKDLYLPSTNDVRVLDLAHLGIVKGTLELTLVDNVGDEVDPLLNPFVKEVPFIDGISELTAQALRTVEKVPTLVPLGPFTRGIFFLKERIVAAAVGGVTFSNKDIYKVEDSLLNNFGDWIIDRNPLSGNYGRVQVSMPSIDTISGDDTGTVTYFYINPKYSDDGLYSVDYANGRIYTQRPTVTGWALTATYQYTDYRAEYKIARVLDPKFYDVDETTRLITIKDEEILKHNILPRGISPQQSLYYQVNYDYVAETREDILALRDFFSPSIKDYVIKVITKSNLI